MQCRAVGPGVEAVTAMVASSKIVCLVLATSLLVGGCGYRGAIQMDKSDAAAQTTATADSGQGKPEGATPKPHKDFILDGLLR